MNLNCTTRAIKYLMFTFNFLFVLTGLVLISVGATIHSNYNAYDVFLDGKYFTLPNLLIATGILIFIISFLGCYGAYKESWIMLFGFSILLGVIFIFEFSAGIAGYVLRDKTLGYLGDTFRTTMPKYNQSSSVAYMWDTIQREFTCCGIEGPKDWVSVLNQSEDLPMSCCPKVDGLIGTQHCNIYVVPINVTTLNNNAANQTTPISTNVTATDNSTESPSTTEDSTPTSNETTNSTTMTTKFLRLVAYASGNATTEAPPANSSSIPYGVGCQTAFGSWVQTHAVDIGSLGFALAVIQVAGIIFACHLSRQLKNRYYST